MAALAIVVGISVVVSGWRLLGKTGDPTVEPTPTVPAEPVSSTEPVEPAGPVEPVVPDPDAEPDLLDQVRVVATRPHVDGYDRDCGPGNGCVFGTEWSDATAAPLARNGCDTRNDVLARDLVDVGFSDRSPDCDVVRGRLDDPYSGAVLDYATEGSQIHVDHLFPLAAAWDLGAASWSPAERATFANDVDLELLAVSGTENLSKSDATLADWLPPAADFRCEYVGRYLAVALAYDLALTAADARTARRVLADC